MSLRIEPTNSIYQGNRNWHNTIETYVVFIDLIVELKHSYGNDQINHDEMNDNNLLSDCGELKINNGSNHSTVESNVSTQILNEHQTNSIESFSGYHSCTRSYRFFTLYDSLPEREKMPMKEGSETISITLYHSLSMPHIQTDKLFQSLCYTLPIKQQLLNYARTALMFASRNVSTQLLPVNRIVLLHGEPGTGQVKLLHHIA